MSVDVIIPGSGARRWIGAAIESVRSQSYPVGSIVVAAHDEETAAAARRHGALVVANPSGTTPAALNLALAESTADVIVRVDAHSVLPPGYIERAVSTLNETAADNVGGMQVPTGITFWEKAIAAAMSSPFGAGDARYRIGGPAGPTDTVYLGVFRRATLDRLGGFDESFLRNQDYEMNHRIRIAGGVVWFDPDLRVTYRPRGSLVAVARQYYLYGKWKREFSRRHPGSLRWRQLAPPALVVLVAAAVVGSIWWRPLLLLPVCYLVALAVVGVASLPRRGLSALGMPLALATTHLSWGVGFILGGGARRRT